MYFIAKFYNHVTYTAFKLLVRIVLHACVVYLTLVLVIRYKMETLHFAIIPYVNIMD